MTKVKVLLPFVQGKKSHDAGDEILLATEVAYKMSLKGVVEFKTKKEFTELDKKMTEQATKELEEKEQKEKAAAAVLRRDELFEKRKNHQIEVDAITDILNDGAEYYKSYIALADDIKNKEDN